VTPAIAVSTREVFDVYDGLRGRGNEATRMSSVHLAEELRSGLSAADLVARAGALTVSNDLLQATLLLIPPLVPFRRTLSRLLARPVGLSGSGPTLWALYASEAEAAIAADAVRVALRDGRLWTPGSAAPFITATMILHTGQQERQP
jgi:4-diphosphocytidyl-2C-methyl-D-erythritol kinase